MFAKTIVHPIYNLDHNMRRQPLVAQHNTFFATNLDHPLNKSIWRNGAAKKRPLIHSRIKGDASAPLRALRHCKPSEYRSLWCRRLACRSLWCRRLACRSLWFKRLACLIAVGTATPQRTSTRSLSCNQATARVPRLLRHLEGDDKFRPQSSIAHLKGSFMSIDDTFSDRHTEPRPLRLSGKERIKHA